MRHGKKAGSVKRILAFTKPYAPLMALAVLFALVGVTCNLLTPILIGKAVDCVAGAGAVDYNLLTGYLLYIALTVAVSALLTWLMTLCTNVVAYRTVRDIRNAMMRKLCRVPLSVIDGRSRGDLMARVVGDVDKISDGLIQGFTQLLTGVVTIGGTIAFMLTINAAITIVVVVVTPLSLITAAFIAKRSHKMFVRQAEQNGELGGFTEEMLTGQRVVKAFGYGSRAESRFDEINMKLYDSGVKSQFASSLTNPTTRFVNGVVYAAVAVSGGLSVLGLFGARLTVGQLSSFLSYANQYTKPFNEITGVVSELQTALAAARRVFEFLDEREESSDGELPELTSDKGNVDIESVYFSYSPEKPLIEDFNLKVRTGERIAIVGPTGCGKTTFINLLMRFYDVNSGCIRVDGEDVREVTRASLRSRFGMVLQESWLFSGSVRDNIAYGKPDASEDEIVAAAKAAYAHGFIRKLPDGYDTVISEGGENLSQGQKQLLSIARVMLTSPPMLILDEATSSIDTRTEQRIQQAFSEMMRGRTSFIVAHRLSTIKSADKILVMNKGSILEQGTHEQLLAKGGFYSNLYNSQFEGRH